MSGARSVYVLPLTYKRESTPARMVGGDWREAHENTHRLVQALAGSLEARQYNT